jgi:tRNA(Ile)-lysidine synthase
MDLSDRVRSTIRRHRLAAPGVRVLAAVSGGSDSVALSLLLRALAARGELMFAGIAHFNHRLRQAADQEERFCEELAARLEVPFVSDREDVGAHARAERCSVESAARGLRHAFLERARTRLEADVVATGHTRDDQAETFLLRLIRGAGARGLSAMHPRHGPVIRPLLDCRRAELRAYVEASGCSWCRDETNEDVSIPRNRVRAELLPFLEARFNSGIVDVLADAADVAREEWLWLSASARDAWGESCRYADGGWHLDASALERGPLGLARMVVWQALCSAAGGRPVGFGHVRSILDLLNRPDGTGIDVPGAHAQRIGQEIVLTSRPNGSRKRQNGGAEVPSRPFSYALPIPGAARIAEAGVELTARLSPRWERSDSRQADKTAGGGSSAAVQHVGTGPLKVRSWRPGDRFRPLGMTGRKKLQDFFVDRKIPRESRPLIPLVVDELDRIVWVAGVGIDEDFRVTEPSQPVLVLRLKPLGGLS